MEKISQGQLICIKTVIGKLKKAGAPEMKDVDAVVLGFSGYRTEHVSELWMPEATALIKHLKSLDPDEVAADKLPTNHSPTTSQSTVK